MMKTLFGHSFIYGAATLISRGSVLVLLLILPFLLTPAEYGVLGVIVAMSAFVNVIVPAEITQAMVRFYAAAPDGEKAVYVSTGWWFTATALLLFLAAAEAAAAPFCRWLLGDEAYLTTFRLGLAVMALTSLFYFLQNQFRWEFRTGGYVVASLFFSLATLGLALGIGFSAANPLEGVLAGQAIGAALSCLFAAWQLRSSLFGKVDKAKLREMLAVSLPIVPASLALLLSIYAARFVLNDVSGLAAVGIFTFASQIAGIAALALAGVQQAVTPLIMANHEDPQTPRMLGRSFEIFIGLGFALCLALGLFAPELIASFGEPAFRDSGPLILPLAMSVVLSGMYFFLPGFLIAKKTSRQMWVALASAVSSVALNYVLASRFGAAGATAATFFSSLIFLFLWFLASQPLYAVPIRWFAVGLSGIATLGGGIAAILIPYPDLWSAVAIKLLIGSAIAGVILATGLIPLRDGLASVRGLLRRPAAEQGP